MRTTVEILSDIEDGKKPDYEEVYMACLVLKSLKFLANQKFKALLSENKFRADCVKRMDFPGAYRKLGISKHEWNALRMDPYEYLGEKNIPGTVEWKAFHDLGMKLLHKALEVEADEKR